jgi:phosphoglycerol transferase MdoB-like AlkP superfamily enzyme
VLYAIYSLKHEARSSEVYGKLTQTEMMEEVLDWPWLQGYQFNDPIYPTMHEQQSTKPREKPLNLVIVLEESLGATFVESLGGLPVTPEIEKLKEAGWWFEQLYATGTRSVRGIEAVMSGYMPTPAQSVVKLSLAQKKLFYAGGITRQPWLSHTVYLWR